MSQRMALRHMLASGTFVRTVGVHDGLTAILAERAGFEAVWAGGLGISAAHGVPDAGLLTMTEFHADAVRIRRVTALPVIADVDAGFGDVNVVRRMVRLYEESGIDAVCIEDKQGPKRNSFRDGNTLEDPEAFAMKISAAKSAQRQGDFVVIARLESLIAGAGSEDALRRAELYCSAGADAVLIHSRAQDAGQIAEFCAEFRARGSSVPIFAVPTTYYTTDFHQLRDLGLAGAIYANQMLRAMIRSGEDLLASLARTGSTAEMEPSIAAVSEVFDLVETDKLIGDLPWRELTRIMTGDNTDAMKAS
ncbi:isocitrate lyase/phosphoenolpyruvate mutase family protein [Streptomyces sp. ME02-8801-2C]|uniref:isocitrate lyase/phosphoenolpyruvate mutase family protein n=1 Tax=Streptomyces sp. ME02-8801-2C TaxID=3028680 RepID=UPI0029BC5E9F|nr:isocitrate lyase/phosphoenolpyruvate mutase family protein [Streptomyces sp. ME02-8801-2C]MDX3458203.1 isocitrate lyase/phosphoenolpyruvate mutase family protein [Streptomyces sp. ME02-8801-2C]